jgi:uncharacterized protein (TIGR00645 family)
MKPVAINHFIELALFASRWLLAPLYLGLIVALGVLLYTFFGQLFDLLRDLPDMKQTAVVLALLTLIDLSLVGNLLVIVMLAGYENFVSSLTSDSREDRPGWLGKVDFGGMKLKLIASIAAILAIHLLEIFMTPTKLDPATVGWLIAIQLTIVFTGIVLAVTDYISDAAKHLSQEKRSAP